MKNMKKVFATMLALAMIISASACESRGGNGAASSGSSEESSLPEFSETLVIKDTDLVDGQPVSTVLPDYIADVQKKKTQNSDTVGWLWVPGTGIDDVVVQREGDLYNEYYLRKDFNKNNYFYGVFYADSRSVISAKRENMGVNTCIYGHAISDTPGDARMDIKFGPLHKFRDEEFAKTHPYIFFSTGEENLAYEVVAVFIANGKNTALPYNSNPDDSAAFVKLLKEQVMPRSLYNYDVDFNENDKFLTLSTCIYTLEDGTDTGYPNTEYRYAVVAKLLDEGHPINSEANFTVNSRPLLDPDGKM